MSRDAVGVVELILLVGLIGEESIFGFFLAEPVLDQFERFNIEKLWFHCQ